ncbi:hypothetical protein DEV91_12210 [Phyllobacterium brassicacearum]|nr:hypothetical protein DEV91_12210 [Phyllobacterium brassicacearum]
MTMHKKSYKSLDICATQHRVINRQGDLSMPSLGVSSLDLGRAYARSFFVDASKLFGRQRRIEEVEVG